jgi:hypothetical protein
MNLPDDLEDGLNYYDPEANLFSDIGQKVDRGGGLSKRDVLLIVKWKLGRIKDANADTVADARMVEINRAVAKAREAGGEVAALEALEKIPGIGLATATALLTVCYPEVFTIIDERVLEMLDLFPSTLPRAKRTRHSTEDWTAREYWNEYVPQVKKQSEAWGCTLRDADRALWGLSVRGRVDEIIDKTEKLPVELVAYDAMDASQGRAFQAMVEEGEKSRRAAYATG